MESTVSYFQSSTKRMTMSRDVIPLTTNETALMNASLRICPMYTRVCARMREDARELDSSQRWMHREDSALFTGLSRVPRVRDEWICAEMGKSARVGVARAVVTWTSNDAWYHVSFTSRSRVQRISRTRISIYFNGIMLYFAQIQYTLAKDSLLN